jgi:hypothetical protein
MRVLGFWGAIALMFLCQCSSFSYVLLSDLKNNNNKFYIIQMIMREDNPNNYVAL